jgi:Tol biopolymer transport system component
MNLRFLAATSVAVIMGWTAIGTAAADTFAQPQWIAPRQSPLDTFAIYSATLDGGNRHLIFSDPAREVNHARVSPDGKWVVFARYNQFDPATGLAVETNGYNKTEIIMCSIDGSVCYQLMAPKDGFIFANANWTPDGSGLYFIYCAVATGTDYFLKIDMASLRISAFYTVPPGFMLIGDPNVVGQKMIYTCTRDERINDLCLYNFSTGVQTQLTSPALANFVQLNPSLGDYDPKLSPDATKAAFMRHMMEGSRDVYHVFTVDLSTGTQTDLTPANTFDAVPEWSSDGRLLIYWGAPYDNLALEGLYVMRPDGTGRTHVPLPGGYFYSMPKFFPNSGAQIIYSSRINPGMINPTLNASPTTAPVKSPISFTANSSGTVDFGDGTPAVLQTNGTVQHAYAKPGTYTATLKWGSTVLATTAVVVTGPYVDAKINGSDGPITVPFGTVAYLSWSSLNTVLCYYTATNQSGATVGAGNVPLSAARIPTPPITQALVFTINCIGSNGAWASDSVRISP